MLDQTILVHELISVRDDISLTNGADTLALYWYCVPEASLPYLKSNYDSVLRFMGCVWIGTTHKLNDLGVSHYEREQDKGCAGATKYLQRA
jgi:hypothetical protein